MTANVWISSDWASPPGETIIDILNDRKISRDQFSQEIGLPQDKLNALINGELTITVGLAQRLHLILGSSVAFWITRDEKYRSELKRIQEQTQNWFEKIPIADMVRLGWFDDLEFDKLDSKAMMKYFGISSVRSWYKKYHSIENKVFLKSSKSFKHEFAAIAAWLRRGELIASNLNCNVWNRDSFMKSIQSMRKLTKQKDPAKFIPILQRNCAEHGVALIIARTPTGCPVSGATMFVSPNKAMIMLSFRYQSDDHFWFAFFHEASHLILHDTEDLLLEGSESSNEEIEKEADAYAANLLIPEVFQEEFKQMKYSYKSVMRFAYKIGVSPGIIVGQLQHMKRVPYSWLNRLKRRYIWGEDELTGES